VRSAIERAQPQQTGAIEHRHPPDLLVAEPAQHALDVLVLVAPANVFAHRVAHLGVRPLAFGDGADGDIPVGDHADQPVVLAHRQRSGVAFGHQRRRLAKRHLRIGELHVASHAV